MGKFRPTQSKENFNLMKVIDKKMKVLEGEPNGLAGKIITVIDGFIGDDEAIMVKTDKNQIINTKFLKFYRE